MINLKGMEIEDGYTYYIADTRTVVGNCTLWWGKDSRGYVCDLNKAGEYSADEAREICASRSTDIPYRSDMVRESAVLHVRIERLRDMEPGDAVPPL